MVCENLFVQHQRNPAAHLLVVRLTLSGTLHSSNFLPLGYFQFPH